MLEVFLVSALPVVIGVAGYYLNSVNRNLERINETLSKFNAIVERMDERVSTIEKEVDTLREWKEELPNRYELTPK